MIRAKLLYLREKQFFVKKGGALAYLGKPNDISKRLKEDGFGLLHIIDLDAIKGQKTNFDVYDTLTYSIHVQAECGANPAFMERLLKINCRVVVHLPADLSALSVMKKSLLGIVPAGYKGSVEDFGDVLLEDATLASVKKFSKLGKRVFVYEKDYDEKMEKLVFAVIYT